ncbi:MAG: GNAT family N-acetyltransferase [Eubacterium sp.]|nr:GNAT family N-acetyltransferase [Eubacterium sp.]
MIFDNIRNMLNNEISIKEQVGDMIITLRAIRFNKEVGMLRGLFESDKKVLLADISNEKCINHGVGSALIMRFEDICRENGVKEIHGNLANVDLDHKDRLIHFYKKHGYSIVEENEEGSFWGKITKEL